MCSARTSVTRKPCRSSSLRPSPRVYVYVTGHPVCAAEFFATRFCSFQNCPLPSVASIHATFQHLPPAPPLELRESRNVVFHKVFPRFHLVEVFLRAHRRRRMSYVAGTLVPIVPDPRDFYFGKIHLDSIADALTI